ncbi:hypothetical protein MHU86_12312 [Fragilaria crotonensis]|nr:hypothetical protein MHU86_12312 [Fragilaria crotonensis]
MSGVPRSAATNTSQCPNRANLTAASLAYLRNVVSALDGRASSTIVRARFAPRLDLSSLLSSPQGGARRSQEAAEASVSWLPRQALAPMEAGATRWARTCARSRVLSAAEANGRCVEARPQFV